MATKKKTRKSKSFDISAIDWRRVCAAVIGLLLAAIVTLTCLMGYVTRGGDNKWFRNFATLFKGAEEFGNDPADDYTNNASGDDTANDGYAIISEIDNNGIELLSATLPRSAYSANNISANADTAFMLTATVLPNDATDKSVDWHVSFVDPSSEWANDKEVSDYVTVEPTSDGALTATVTNFAPFGEQIIITVTSRANPEATAKCTVDYLQKLEDVLLHIGDVAVAPDNDTFVTVLLGKDTGGSGGAIALEKTFSDVYTLTDTYTETVSFSGGQSPKWKETEYFSWFGSAPSGVRGNCHIVYDDIDNAIGKQMYFDRRLFADYNFLISVSNSDTNEVTTTAFAEESANFIYYNLFANSLGRKLWDISITLAGTYKTYSYETALRCNEVDTTVPTDDVEIDENIIF